VAALPKRVYLLGWISLWADVASEMVYPILPIYLTTVLMAQPSVLGLVEGFAAAIVSFMRGWSGWHSDRTGKRVPLIQLGYGLSALGKPLIAFPGGWPMLFAARSLDRVGKGLRTTARDALIADSVGPEQYGAAFGLHRAMDTTGAFLGGVLAIVLLILIPRDLKWIFYIAFIPGLISVAITALVKDPKPEAGEEVAPTPDLKAIARSLPKAYWGAVVVTFIFGLANSSDTFLLLRANDTFKTSGGFDWLRNLLPPEVVANHFPLILTTLVYLLYNIAYVGLSYPAGIVSDRSGRWRVITVGWILYAVVYVGFAYSGARSIWWLFILYGVYIGLADGVSKALVADFAPKAVRGTALGIFYMAAGVATILGNILAGWLWTAVSPEATFYAGSALAVIAVLGVPVLARLRKTPDTATS
jgi:MFS family permease